MRNLYGLLFILALHANTFSQSTQNNAYNIILDIENQIVAEDFDQTAIELITDYNKSVKTLNKFRLDIINTYDDALTQNEKNKRFRSEHFNSEIFRDLQENMKLNRISKVNYLSANYPEYAKHSSGATGKRKLKQRDTVGKFKVKRVPVGSLKSKG